MNHSRKPPLADDDHSDVVDLALHVGQLLLQHGAETSLIEASVHRLGTALGADWLDVYVSPNALVISSVNHGQFRTRTRRVPERPVNMTVISCITRLIQRVEDGRHTLAETRAELERILSLQHDYRWWQIVLCIGLSCASFCWLFGGRLPEMLVTFVASASAMRLRQVLAHRGVNLYITVGATAFLATLIASAAPLFHWGEKPDTALAAAVLLLIPGVPFINSIQDLIQGYTLMGLARWSVGTLITLCIALGMILALAITRVAL